MSEKAISTIICRDTSVTYVLVGGVRVKDFVKNELVPLNKLCHVDSHPEQTKQ